MNINNITPLGRRLSVASPALAALAALLITAFAGKAQASGNSQFGFTISINGSDCGPWRCAPPQPCPPPRPACPPPSWASREFERGINAGQRDGHREGFEDGRCGRGFNPASCERLSHTSRPFREGFQRGFCDGYRDGFERGRCSRPCPSPPPRRWCR